VVLLSDDYDWLVEETGKLKANPAYEKWNFYIPPPPVDPKSPTLGKDKTKLHRDEKIVDYNYMRSRGGTESGVYLFSSIQLIQQCSAFVGHMESSITRLFYSMMCHRHNGLEGYCPPLYNVEWDQAYYQQQLKEYWISKGWTP
jgi:hypothetical protein